MKSAPKPWPLVIDRLVAGFVDVAKDHGVHGRVRVSETKERSVTYYPIAVLVPAAETVPARSSRS
jgi:hypothetical protein